MKQSKSSFFNPPIEPVISSGEIRAYTAMIDGQLAPEKTQVLSVIVVGAGLAGLAAARELKKSGAKVTILEGSDRAGGRCHTLSSNFDDGLFAEAGGLRIPDSHKILMKYVHHFGLSTMPFANMKDKTGLLFFDGKREMIDRNLGDPTSVLARVVEKWEESIRPIREAYSNGILTWDEITVRYGSMSLINFLHQEKWTTELIEGFAKYGIGFGAYESILELSFHEILRLVAVKNMDTKNFQIEGGNESLVNSFLFDDNIPLNSIIEYGYKVESIEQNSRGRYLVSGGTACKTYECDHVIVTVPLPQLRSIAFDPPLRNELSDAINNAHYVKATKVFLQTKSRFWLKHGVDGMMISDLKIQNTYFAPAFPSSTKGLITASYVWEHQAEKFFALSEEEKIKLAVDELKQVFPEMEEEFELGAAVEWKQAFCIFRPGQGKMYHKTLREEALPGIFLAGEHCSVEHGYFEGALESGLRAAANVFRSVDEKFLDRFDNFVTCKTPKSTEDSEVEIGKPQYPVHTSPTSVKDSLLLPAAARTSFRSDKIIEQSKLPIFAKRLDHYTLICSNAKKVAEFHVNHLQFELDSIKPVNSGTVSEGEHDMLNYILRPPGNKDMVMVVTEGLNDDTIFRKYMKAHGHGVHHFAFEVDNIDIVFAAIKDRGIQTTSEKVTTDIISGLKQFFIAPSHAGFFIEMIERPSGVDAEKSLANTDREELFTSNNMAELAQSISRFVTPEINRSSQISDVDNEVEKKEKCDGEDDIANFMTQVSVGKIAAVEITVEDIISSASFLVDTLNFRFIRHTGDKIFIALPGKSDDINIVLNQSRFATEERKATIVFDAPTLTRRKVKEMAHSNFEEATKAGMEGILLPDKHTTYKVLLVNKGDQSMQSQIVRSHPSFFDLEVDIKADQAELIDFLADPENLSTWTVHRGIHYSPKRKSWVETRSDGAGALTDFIVEVEVIEDSKVRFCWPQRKLEIVFHCSEIAPGYSSVCLRLPSSLDECTLVRTKRMLSIELDLLKSILERNTQDVIPDRFFHQIHAQHLKIYGTETKHVLPKYAAEEFGFRGEIITSGSLFEQMSTDFALTIKSRPLAVLIPIDVDDVRAAVKMANAYDIPLAARGSRVSHSAGGQAQADGGLVLDMSPLCTVEFGVCEGSNVVKAGAGTFWDEVIRQTLQHGMMPPVVNDYQYLSVGGTISMGGVGFMSHRYGIQAGHVDELEIVTGKGDLLTCSKEDNSDLYDCARGGLGQCGIITSVTIPLVKAPTAICTYRIFYRAFDASMFLEDVKDFVESGHIDMIHAFLKPCTKECIGSILGSDEFAASSNEFKSLIQQGESTKSLVYFLELGSYSWDNRNGDETTSKTIENLLSSKQDRFLNGEYFTEENDFATYIRKDPPVVETNKEHGQVPHPSFATLIDETKAQKLLDCHLHSNDRGDDKTNEILIMPVKKTFEVPMFSMPKDSELSYFLLFLGSVIPGQGSSKMSEIRAHHRKLHSLSSKLGGKRYSYDTITAEVQGPTAWKDHIGCERAWESLVNAKRRFDPNHILCPGVNMWKENNDDQHIGKNTEAAVVTEVVTVG